MTAATSYNSDLHPRGRDGKFIETLGLIRLTGGTIRGKDGTSHSLTGLRGRVEAITPDKKSPGNPTIRVRLLGPDGKPGPAIDVKPHVISSADEKARIAQKKPSRLPYSGPKKTYDSGSKWPDPVEQTDWKPTPRPPETPEQKERRLAAEEARGATDLELDAQQGKGPEVWRNAIAAEQERRAKQAAADAAKRQGIIDKVNAQAASLSTTDAETRAVQLDKILAPLRFSIIDTDQVYDHLYPPSESGEWRPDRAAKHEEMWADVLSQVEAAGIPKDRDAFVLGGLPGAGKTYMLRPGQKAGGLGVVAWEPDSELPDGVTHVSINPDAIKEMMATRGMLPEGLSADLKPMEQATFLHKESTYLAKLFQDRLSAEGYNLAVDRTFESDSAMQKLMAPLARKGYTFRALFVDIPVDESLASTKKRYIETALTPLGGRFVPSSVQGNRKSTKGNLSKNRDAFDRFIDDDWFGEYMIVDNTGISTTPPSPKGEIIEHEDGGGTGATRYLPAPSPAPVV